MPLLNDQHAQRIVQTMAADKSAVLADVNEVSGRVATVEQALASGNVSELPLVIARNYTVPKGKREKPYISSYLYNSNSPNYGRAYSNSTFDISNIYSFLEGPEAWFSVYSDSSIKTDGILFLHRFRINSGSITTPKIQFKVKNNTDSVYCEVFVSFFKGNNIHEDIKELERKYSGNNSTYVNVEPETVDISNREILLISTYGRRPSVGVFVYLYDTNTKESSIPIDISCTTDMTWTDVNIDYELRFLCASPNITNNIQVPSS